MNTGKIPLVNDRFDFTIFIQILRKTYWVALILVILSSIAAFLYLRYTPPLYHSVSVIQINEMDRTSSLLNIEDVYHNTDISKTIELIRSKEFLKRAFNKLPLEVSYFNEGTFLSTELYLNCPYSIEVKVNSNELYNRPFYIDFIDGSTAKIYGRNKHDKYEKIITLNEWNQIDGGQLRCRVLDYTELNSHNLDFKSIRYYFILNNPQEILATHIPNLDISLLNSSAQTIQILYAGNNAEKTQQIVNTIAEEYLKYDVEVKKESAANILAFIDDQLRSVYKNLDETEKQIHTFKKENKIADDKLQQNSSPFPIFLSKMNELEDKLVSIDYELLALNQVKSKLNDKENVNIYELLASLSGTQSEQVMINILNNLQQLINQRDQLLNNITTDNLKVKMLEKQIENQTELTNDFVNSTIDRLTSKKVEYQEKIKNYQDKLFNEKQYDELEYSKLSRLYEINEGFYHQLIEKKAEYMISQAGYVSQNTILERANLSILPISPLSKKIYPFFFLMGLLAGGVYIALRYLLYDEVSSINTIQNYTSAPILGIIPVYRKEIPVSQLLVSRDSNSVFSEAFRTIRSNLQFISHGAETKIVTISSTISGEGKTFVAINLAGILSITGKRVVLLDLDLRKPRIHLGFNANNEKGVSTLLIGRYKLEQCIQKSELPNFDFITAGPVPPNPSELANSKAMEMLLNDLEELYDIIIIDTPPVGIVTDALPNLHRANYPIYVMNAKVSRRYFIENINRLRKEKGMDNLSIILNAVELQYRRYGSYGYGYGYGYYAEDEEKETTVAQKLSRKLLKLKK
jgi:tyrosine-protein kinase Etk/Wzc